MRILVCLLILNLSVNAGDKALRIIAENGMIVCQAGLFTFEKDSVKVTYISAVHIGSASYYKKLNEGFKNYDAVLFEKITGYQEALKDNGVDQSPWDIIAEKLKLKSQLKSIDYKAVNLVHADMSLAELLENKDEYKISKDDILNPRKMKQAAKAFKEAPASILLGLYRNTFKREDLKNPAIIEQRNLRCMKIFDEQQAKHKKIAIFFGAAHFKDMKKLLLLKGFKQTKTSWLSVFKELVP